MTIPRGAGVGDIADVLPSAGRHLERVLLRAARHGRRQARRPQAGHVHAAPGHELRRRARRARARARRANIVKRHDPRGPLAPRGRRDRRRAGCSGDYMTRDQQLDALNPRRYGGKQRQEPRGLPVPGDLRAEARPPRRRRSSTQQLHDVQARVRARSTCATRKTQEPDRLRRADDRLDGRARGRSSRKERPIIASVIYNRLQARDPARHRRDHPLRDQQLGRAADAVRARDRLALQHAHSAGPAAGADRQPGPRVDQGGRATRRRPSYLFYVVKPGEPRRARVLDDRRRVPARRRALQPERARRGRQVARRDC